MSRISIKDINVGDGFSSIFLVAAASLADSKNGPFWRLELKDASGSIEAKIWSPLSQRIEEIKLGDFVEIRAKASLFRDQLQLSIEAFRIVENSHELDYADFLPTSKVPPAELLNELENLIQNELDHAPWANLVKSVLTDKNIRAKLLLAPAAKSVHHAYLGGLLDHTLSVVKLCIKLCEHYPELDRQLLIVAAIFHDIGKIEELSGGIANDYTDEGKLLGHIVQGIIMLRPHLEKSKLDKNLIMHLEHLILSHHGELEYGAAKVPLTAEAFALHYADNIDAKMAQLREVFENNSNMVKPNLGQEQILWSPWVNLLGRNLCQLPKTPQQHEKETKKPQPDERQGSLLG